MDYSFDFSPEIGASFDYSVPNMSVGTGGYTTPDVQMSVGTPDTTYAGGQYFSGETGSWGGAGYSPEQYYSALAAQFGSDPGIDVFHNPVPTWWPDNNTLVMAQNACLVIGMGCALASGVGALIDGGLLTGLSMSSLATPEGVTIGTSVIGAAGQYASQNAGELSTIASEMGPEVSMFGSEVSGIAAEGLATSPNAAVFWSGLGPEGESLAASWASTNSGLTLEMTMAQRGIVLPAWDAANPASVEAWRTAAAEFASGASGSVRVLQGDFVGSSSIWASVEFPTLVQNPAVTSITAVNPMTSWETSLWTR